jgi:hypothetical protein
MLPDNIVIMGCLYNINVRRDVLMFDFGEVFNFGLKVFFGMFVLKD